MFLSQHLTCDGKPEQMKIFWPPFFLNQSHLAKEVCTVSIQNIVLIGL